MRTVKIYAEIPEGISMSTYQRCLGRLITYAHYPYVSIANDGKKDLVAAYRHTEESGPVYVIGAIWNEKTEEYNFHS